MPTKNPRLNIVLEQKVFKQIKTLAKKDGCSLSLKARDLIIGALELNEDLLLANMASDRESTYKPSEAKTHQEAWAKK